MKGSPALLLGIVAAIVLGLGVTLVVLVKQANTPIVVEAAPVAAPPPAIATPSPPIATPTPTPAPTPEPAPAPPPAEVVATPSPAVRLPPPVAAEVVPTPPAEGDAPKHKNRRFNRGLMPGGRHAAGEADPAPAP